MYKRGHRPKRSGGSGFGRTAWHPHIGEQAERRRVKRVILGMLAAILFSAAPASAQFVIEEKITFLNTRELKTIYGKGKFTLVNTLSPVEFNEKRIAGSINIPLSHYADGKVSLPGDKEARFVFYCMGEK